MHTPMMLMASLLAMAAQGTDAPVPADATAVQ
jgi:hypothetical protein